MNRMTVKKEAAASQSHGRGMDNYRVPARYAVLDATGTKVGVILGTDAGFMDQSKWEVCWISPAGIPRTVHYAASFKAAKAWAEAWDGLAPPRWR